MNSVLMWNAVLLEVSRRDFTRGYVNAAQPGPIRTSRAMALVHIAIHDAVALRTKPAAAYMTKKGVPIAFPLPTGKVDDVVAGAAVTTLTALYPGARAYIEAAMGTTDAAAFASGVSIGNAILAMRAGDGNTTMLTGPQPVDPGYGVHRADPFDAGQPQLGPVWGNVTRFLGAAHQPLDPYPGHGTPDFLSDPDHRADFDEVRDLGAIRRGARTAEQERIGLFWGYDGVNNIGVPPRLYNQLARVVVGTHTPPLSTARTAELFASINVAMADAGIDAWHHKYVYDLWRPVIGIRLQPGVEGDPFWAPHGAPQTNGSKASITPPFPAYPSGHATFGASVLQALRLGLHTAAAPISVQDVLDVEAGTSPAIAAETFTMVSDELDGVSLEIDGSVRTRVPVTFTNFAEVVWENSLSRVYRGVHWRFDGIPRDATKNIGGVPLGLAIGAEAHAFFNQAPSLGGTV